MGKPSDPAYWRRWRAAHPEYRARERERLRAWRAAHPEQARRSEAARRARRRAEQGVPPLHQGHALLAEAVAVARALVPASTYVALVDPLYDDVVGAAVLALVEGRNPHDAARAEQARERAWRAVTMELWPAR